MRDVDRLQMGEPLDQMVVRLVMIEGTVIEGTVIEGIVTVKTFPVPKASDWRNFVQTDCRAGLGTVVRVMTHVTVMN